MGGGREGRVRPGPDASNDAGRSNALARPGGVPTAPVNALGLRGGNGGPSSLAGDGIETLVALGGGGGAGSGNGYGTSDWAGAGGEGIACGGGAGDGGTTTGNALGTQGGNGGAATTYRGGDNAVGGGGGAGGNGEDAPDNLHSGAGGPGLASDITGETVYYGGGGGGGNGGMSPTGGAGGIGGGASGNPVGSSARAPSGTDGLGGGGAGGCNDGGSANCIGGAGGSGVVILRYSVGDLSVRFLNTAISGLSSEGATLTATPFLTGATVTDETRVEVRLGTGPAADALVFATVSAAAGSGVPLSSTVSGLDSGQTLFYQWVAFDADDNEVGASDVASFATLSDRPAMDPVEAGVADVFYTATDKVIRFRRSGTLRVTASGVVRALLVGGGGAGGTNVGAGGGGGGVLDETGVILYNRDWPVVVGAGGVPSPGTTVANGGAGGDSMFASLLAGGGAGGSASDGGASGSTRGFSGTTVGGNAGGQANNSRGGGGGAGEAGHTPVNENYSGSGGDGAVSDITGESVVYGGGGAGGRSGAANGRPSGVAAFGGKGGGGNGAAAGSGEPPEAGADGLGGGGAGGGAGSETLAPGGAGGSGVVIVRFPASGAWAYGLRVASRSSQGFELSGSVGLAGADAPASVAVEVGVAPAAGGVFEWTAAASSVAAGAAFSGRVSGLSPCADYRLRVRLLAGGNVVFESDDLAARTPGMRLKAVAESGAADGVEEFSLPGGDVVARFRASGMFSVSRAGTVRILLVGGGGSGGGDCTGGGGGGGGFVEKTEVDLAPGDYVVTVGAGGATPSGMSRGNIGSASSFIGPDVKLVAFGGGAGGTGFNNGYAGGCGGGEGGTITANWRATRPVGAQGGRGGSVLANEPGGGGGGAGADGGDGGATANRSGDGGDGLSSDITGEVVWYAGGGGGGCGGNTPISGKGGRGGGGGRGDQRRAAVVLAEQQGVDGLGGGGAGGSNGANSAGVNVSSGGKGGDGVVILRWSDPTGTIILIK